MSRVFFITANQLKVFEWKKNTLVGCYAFKNDGEGKNDFLEYAKITRHIPAKILLEVIEEEFHREEVPHIDPINKSKIINRRIRQHFHDSSYINSQFIRRKKDGNKNDEYLFTAISNPALLQLWLGVIKIYKLPIVGIWSVPLISHEVLRYLPKNIHSILLVSRQMRSTVRESFFKNGRLILSRQVRINREQRNDRIASTYLSHGADQIHKFLTNQKIIQFNEKLEVVCLMPGDLLAEAEQTFSNTESLQYHFLSLDDIFEKRKIDSDWEREADALFAYICSKKPVATEAYLPKPDRQLFFHHVARQTLKVASTLGALLLVSLATILLLYNREIKEEIDFNSQLVAMKTARYDREFSDKEYEINVAQEVKSVVNYAERLFVEAQISPEQLLMPLGNILDENRFSRVYLRSLTWQKLSGRELDELRREIWKKSSTDLDEYAEYEYNEEEVDDKVAVVTLKGVMDRSDYSYRDTVRTMNAFIERLTTIEHVQQLLVNSIPVDVRDDSKFQDQSGADNTGLVKNRERDTFDIVLLMTPSDTFYTSEDGSSYE